MGEEKLRYIVPKLFPQGGSVETKDGGVLGFIPKNGVAKARHF